MTKTTAENIWKAVGKIRRSAPLVHNITNYVVMNTTANALLALGASPVMAHAEEEVREMVGLAGALVVNLGTISAPWARAARIAMEEAEKRKTPVVFDPVGAGATSYRTDTYRELVTSFPPSIIRGNASEIMALAGAAAAATKGVDSTSSSRDALEAAAALAGELGGAVCVSGETDYIIGRGSKVRIENGHPLMARITGLGCAASALCGAFAAVEPDPVAAAAGAMAVLGIAGEEAAEKASGPGSFQYRLLDALHLLDEETIRRRLKAADDR